MCDAIVNKDVQYFTYAIIGGGIAGVTCAEHLHILDSNSPIVLITSMDVIKAVTNVLHVTKTLDTFDVEEKHLSHLASQCPNVIVLKEEVTMLNTEQHLFVTKSGSRFMYQKLCICAGAIPKSIDEKHPRVLCIRDTDSVLCLQERLLGASRIVIVGNGGIASEMVYELTGFQVIWVIRDKHMNATFIDPGAAEFLRPELLKGKCNEEKVIKRTKFTIEGTLRLDGADTFGGALGPDWHSGLNLHGTGVGNVTVLTGVDVKCILPDGQMPRGGVDLTGEWPVYVELSDGTFHGCDFVVSAVGVVPNCGLFLTGNQFQLAKDGGLLVDDHMTTTCPDVYAAGDVCSPGWQLAPHWFQMRLWTQARHMGSYAAKCMWAAIHGEEIYMDFSFELFSHITKFFGHKVVLLGLFNGQKLDRNYEILLRVTNGMEYVKCIIADGRLHGAILIGETDLEETFENLILDQMDIGHLGDDLLNPAVDIEDYFD